MNVPNPIALPATEPRRGPCGRPLPIDDDALLYPAETAYLLALSERTLEGLRVKGGGPTFCRLRRSIRYRRADVLGWILARRMTSTAQAADTQGQ
jgi:hypothetical protein